MREKIIGATLLLASLAFAQYETSGDYFGSSEPTNSTSAFESTSYSTNSAPAKTEKKDPYYHTHKGFYFSTSLTFGYTYLRYNNHDVYYDGVEIDEYKFTGFMTPYEEVRLGGSIANVASVYGLLGFGIGTGTFKTESVNDRHSYDDSYSYDNGFYHNQRKYDATSIKFYFGAGCEFYPIQDIDNPMYGLFLGLSYGLAVDGAFYEKVETSDGYKYDKSEGFITGAFRFEVGKDFWFSRRWSFGVAFNYTIGWLDLDDSDYYDRSYQDSETYAQHTFGLTIRLSH